MAPRSFIWFAGTALASGLVILAGAAFTLDRVAEAVAAAPVNSAFRPSYVASLHQAGPSDFDIALSVPVAPSVETIVATPSFTHEVVVDSLWVRAKPTMRSARFMALKRGALLSLIGNQGNWSLVTIPDGGSGWVYTSYLRQAPANLEIPLPARHRVGQSGDSGG
jgi:uncharacterized protein YgiM (DUF1202 family)